MNLGIWLRPVNGRAIPIAAAAVVGGIVMLVVAPRSSPKPRAAALEARW